MLVSALNTARLEAVKQRTNFSVCAAENPTVQALLDAFPGAEIAAVRDILPEETEEIDADGEVVPAEEVNELEGDT